MYTKEETIFFMEQSDKVLNVITNQLRNNTDILDSQDVVEVVIMTTYLTGKNNKKESNNIIRELNSCEATDCKGYSKVFFQCQLTDNFDNENCIWCEDCCDDNDDMIAKSNPIKNSYRDITKEETIFFMEQSNKILEIIKTQLRNDENSLTQGDLQGTIEAIIMTVYLKGKNNKMKNNRKEVNKMTWSNASKKYYYSEKGKVVRLKYQKSDKAKESRKRFQEKLKLKRQKAKEEAKKELKPINIITQKVKATPKKMKK